MKPQAVNPHKLNAHQIMRLSRWMESNGIDPAKVRRSKIVFTGNRIIFQALVFRQRRTGGQYPVVNPRTGLIKARRRNVRVRVPFKGKL